MRSKIRKMASIVMLCGVAACGALQAHAQDKNTAYPTMAPIDQYLTTDQAAEIALARSAAPASIADAAEIMVLGRDGYTVAVKGSNGFTCLVERSWAKTTDDAEFWNPKMRAPNCFNAAATRTVVPINMLKTKLVMEGKSREQIAATLDAAWEHKKFTAPAAGAMAYMMSKQQYLDDKGKSWHPHTMFYSPGDDVKSWGSNFDDSPVMAAADLQDKFTILFVIAPKWSDGTPAPHAD